LLRQPGMIADRTAAMAAANLAERQALQLIGTYPLFSGPLDYAVRKGLANFGSIGFASPVRKNVGWQKPETIE
jgi:peptide/nickel transport system substrate-binding protein